MQPSSAKKGQKSSKKVDSANFDTVSLRSQDADTVRCIHACMHAYIHTYIQHILEEYLTLNPTIHIF